MRLNAEFAHALLLLIPDFFAIAEDAFLLRPQTLTIKRVSCLGGPRKTGFSRQAAKAPRLIFLGVFTLRLCGFAGGTPMLS
jgi:hypothetical protein